MKYEIDKYDNKRINGKQVFRVIATESFGNVVKGEKGGYVACEDNLSQFGNCWIDTNSFILDTAVVYGDAQINQSTISGHSIVCDQANIHHTMVINAHISGNAKLYESNIDESTIDGNVEIFSSVVNLSSVSDNCYVSFSRIVFSNLYDNTFFFNATIDSNCVFHNHVSVLNSSITNSKQTMYFNGHFNIVTSLNICRVNKNDTTIASLHDCLPYTTFKNMMHDCMTYDVYTYRLSHNCGYLDNYKKILSNNLAIDLFCEKFAYDFQYSSEQCHVDDIAEYFKDPIAQIKKDNSYTKFFRDRFLSSAIYMLIESTDVNAPQLYYVKLPIGSINTDTMYIIKIALSSTEKHTAKVIVNNMLYEFESLDLADVLDNVMSTIGLKDDYSDQSALMLKILRVDWEKYVKELL